MAVDVVVAGGGPAGATLAILLGRAGLRVDVYDARHFPREKPCGEGIMPGGVAVLGRLGLRDAVGGRALSAVRYHGFGLTAAAPFSSPGRTQTTALSQRRLRLDDALIRAARATPGVRLYEDAAVEGAEIENGRAVGLRVGGEIRRGALVVGADGLESPVRRSLGLDVAARAPTRAGVRMHFRLAPGRTLADNLEIFVGRGFELYAAPLPDGELLVAGLADEGALGSSARAALERWIASWPFLRDALEGATPLTAPAGRARVARRARAGFAPGAVLLGDAARASDPLTAGGISHALATAERLAEIVPRYLAEGDHALQRFDRARHRLLRPQDWLTRALVQIVRRPLLAHATLLSMRALPPVMRQLVSVAGAAGVHPPAPAVEAAPARDINQSVATAASSTPALAISSATAQNATLPQRAESP
ncbi:MAG TPA: NAD(P)/FAD-dependent oxidoreductase [Polyangia bacterium]|nr:NAD(P)/FAD-dependent oxidoreductase [Polyangia bacterium]